MLQKAAGITVIMITASNSKFHINNRGIYNDKKDINICACIFANDISAQ